MVTPAAVARTLVALWEAGVRFEAAGGRLRALDPGAVIDPCRAEFLAANKPTALALIEVAGKIRALPPAEWAELLRELASAHPADPDLAFDRAALTLADLWPDDAPPAEPGRAA